jgi:hypothetical protein
VSPVSILQLFIKSVEDNVKQYIRVSINIHKICTYSAHIHKHIYI